MFGWGRGQDDGRMRVGCSNAVDIDRSVCFAGLDYWTLFAIMMPYFPDPPPTEVGSVFSHSSFLSKM